MLICLVLSKLYNLMDYSLPGSSVHGDSPGKNTEVGCRFLLQGIFPTQGLSPDLPHWQVGSLPLSHQGSPESLIPKTKLNTSLSIYQRTAYFQQCLCYFQLLLLADVGNGKSE